MGYTETVYLPGGDHSRVDVRLSTSALAALQGAIAAATAGQLTTSQASDVIRALQAYISVADTEAMNAGVEPAELVSQQKLDAADAEPLTLAGIRALGSRLTRHQAATAIHLLTAASRRPVRHTDAAESVTPTHSDYGLAVFKARERWLETGSPEDKRHFDEAYADLQSRVIDLDPTCDATSRACPIHFDAAAKTRTSCDCDRASCACSFNPDKKIKTHMNTRSSDYEQGQRDAAAALAHTDARDAIPPWKRPLLVTTSNPGRPTHLGAAERAPWLRPLSEAVPAAQSKDTTRAHERHRAHLDAEDAETVHYREQAELHAKIREKHQRELLTGRPHLDADEDAGTCSGCELPKADCTCERGTTGQKNQRSLAPAGGTPPWKQPLLVSSERTAPIPSQAMRFGGRGSFGGGDAA